MGIKKLTPVFKHYDWGKTSKISKTFLKNRKKLSEVWFGEIAEDENLEKAFKKISEESMTETNFPVSVKFLTSSKPLSVQVHPAKEDLEILKKEELASKEELLLAVEDSLLFCGFQEKEKVLENFKKFLPISYQHIFKEFDELENEIEEAKFFRKFFSKVLSNLDSDYGDVALKEFFEKIKTNKELQKIYKKCNYFQLLKQYENKRDFFILSPLFLSLKELKDGERILIRSGIIHQVLKGSFIELLTNSETVFRLGVTKKEVDYESSLETIYFEKNVYRLFFAGSTYLTAYNTLINNMGLDELTGYYYNLNVPNGYAFLINLDAKGSISYNDKIKKFKKGESFFINTYDSVIRLNKKGRMFLVLEI